MNKGDYAYYVNKKLGITPVVIDDVEDSEGEKRYRVTHIRTTGRKGFSWWCNEPSLFPTMADAEKRVREIVQTRET
jgi:hypothetical protein